MRGQLLGQKDGAMLTSCATERHHQVLEPATLVAAYSGIHEGRNVGEEITHAVQLCQVIDYLSVLAR